METIIGDANSADLIKDGSTQTFAADVIEASAEVPVIVDFWAPWCGPCKQLGPMIERAVKQAGGAVRLVKINVDENQEIAAQLRIQSIPAVYAFKAGRPVDGFVGALPESQIKSFITRLAGDRGPSAVELALEQADGMLAEGDAAGAAELYSQVLQHEADNPQALGGLARALIAAGDLDQARDLLDSIDSSLAGDSHIAGARAALELAGESSREGGGDTTAFEQRLSADPNDHEARFDLAMARFSAGQREAAVDGLLEIVRRDRAWNDEAARKQLVKLFEAFGPTDPLTVDARRRLSSVLFS